MGYVSGKSICQLVIEFSGVAGVHKFLGFAQMFCGSALCADLHSKCSVATEVFGTFQNKECNGKQRNQTGEHGIETSVCEREELRRSGIAAAMNVVNIFAQKIFVVGRLVLVLIILVILVLVVFVLIVVFILFRNL